MRRGSYYAVNISLLMRYAHRLCSAGTMIFCRKKRLHTLQVAAGIKEALMA